MLKEKTFLKNILKKTSNNPVSDFDIERTSNGEIFVSKLLNFQNDNLNLDIMIKNRDLKFLLMIPFNIGQKTEYTSYTYLNTYVEEDKRNYELNTLFKLEVPRYNFYVNRFYIFR